MAEAVWAEPSESRRTLEQAEETQKVEAAGEAGQWVVQGPEAVDEFVEVMVEAAAAAVAGTGVGNTVGGGDGEVVDIEIVARDGSRGRHVDAVVGLVFLEDQRRDERRRRGVAVGGVGELRLRCWGLVVLPAEDGADDRGCFVLAAGGYR